jgi:single-stranded DNA-specific DHH superfamily exonuclease
MLTQEQYTQILEELDNCNKPLYFFHDDADGLASFLLLYKYKREGKGVCVKSQPKVDSRFFKVVKEYCPDKIFILDLAIVEQDFVDEFRKIPIIWLDHHTPLDIKGIKYFNPRKENSESNICVANLCYDIVRTHRPQDLWIAAAGIIGDWQLGKVTEEFSEKYSELLPSSIKKPEKALFETPFSKIIKIMNFILKGKTQDVMKCVKVMTRIESPQELLEGTTSKAKYILKRFEKIDELYETLKKEAIKKVSKNKLLLVKYKENTMSFTGEISNELLYLYPDKVILVAREKTGEMKCSLRSNSKVKLREVLEKALEGVEGYGGGHEYACGACVKVKDFDRFVENIRMGIS